MATGTLISVEEYLTTVYRPDCDYIDGVVEERNRGEWDHATVQGAILAYFHSRRKQWKLRAVPEVRVQVAPSRFRIPDVAVVLEPGPFTSIVRRPPFICIEVLSPEDRLARIRKRIDDFLAFGVPHIWVVDAVAQCAFVYNADGLREVKDGVLRTSNPEIFLPLAKAFEDLEPASEDPSVESN
jgi:Uma2 family endonuclease